MIAPCPHLTPVLARVFPAIDTAAEGYARALPISTFHSGRDSAAAAHEREKAPRPRVLKPGAEASRGPKLAIERGVVGLHRAIPKNHRFHFSHPIAPQIATAAGVTRCRTEYDLPSWPVRSGASDDAPGASEFFLANLPLKSRGEN